MERMIGDWSYDAVETMRTRLEEHPHGGRWLLPLWFRTQLLERTDLTDGMRQWIEESTTTRALHEKH
jgi:hypothetical protein